MNQLYTSQSGDWIEWRDDRGDLHHAHISEFERLRKLGALGQNQNRRAGGNTMARSPFGTLASNISAGEELRPPDQLIAVPVPPAPEVQASLTWYRLDWRTEAGPQALPKAEQSFRLWQRHHHEFQQAVAGQKGPHGTNTQKGLLAQLRATKRETQMYLYLAKVPVSATRS